MSGSPRKVLILAIMRRYSSSQFNIGLRSPLETKGFPHKPRYWAKVLCWRMYSPCSEQVSHHFVAQAEYTHIVS
ncbi:hypothetical protein M407DRAFT_243539 [Tulasnella calospora MUT 4182]|uniref:Uncharacterized protein n=1 Tax=Tulasnella calospora MUT 4182 TaxID=1051891 RepID=A0A0C3Q9W8_9AGAM|nr:hypothetical protein M407DRAFT_243539 [Tulasnella calospora MUT 4182]